MNKLPSILKSNKIPNSIETTRLIEINEKKRVAAIERLGERWLFHPSNKVQRSNSMALN
jgi:hypothetical protein